MLGFGNPSRRLEGDHAAFMLDQVGSGNGGQGMIGGAVELS